MGHEATPIILIHGAWFGSWCWEPVIRALDGVEADAVAIDLPGRPGNPLAVADVTLDAWIEYICSILLDLERPALLAAHSLGSLPAIGACESLPKLVSALVVICGFLLKPGQSAVDVIRADRASQMKEARTLASDGSYSSVDPRHIGDILCTDCSARDVSFLAANLVPESTSPALAPIHWSKERFGAVPRYYVECSRDRIISPQAQRRMRLSVPCSDVMTLPTGHVPFLTKPLELAGTLRNLSKEPRNGAGLTQY